MKHSTPLNGPVPALAEDLNSIVISLVDIVDKNILSQFMLSPPNSWMGASGMTYCNSEVLKAKLGQFVSYLEHIYALNSQIVEIGSLFNSIKDSELKERCSDLLSASGNFDRVINQATLVLENRIRIKSQIERPMSGVQLVNAALSADPSKSVLRISDNSEEHEGICHICRGLMLSFRNPTHHHILDKYTREDALKLCGFIDNILHLVDNSLLNNR